MSALAPTTCNQLPLDTIEAVLDFLGPASQEAYGQIDPQTIDAYYLNRIAQNQRIQNSYAASQEAHGLDLREQRNRFIQKIQRLVGGEAFIEKIEAHRASILGEFAQLQLSDAYWNCKVIGLLPFLQAIGPAQECLREIASIDTNEEKFRKMVAWVHQNKALVSELQELSIVQCRIEAIKDWVLPLILPSSEKVYNYVPKEMALFSGLKKLSFHNNFLHRLPDAIGEMGLEELDIGKNCFQEMPPVIPSLKRLNVTGNSIPFEQVIRYIQAYIRLGGKELEIGVEPPSEEDFHRLRSHLPSSYVLNRFNEGLFVKKIITRSGIPLLSD